MTQMGDPGGKPPAIPKSGARLTSEQLSTPPRQLAAKVRSPRVAAFRGSRPWGGDKIAFAPVENLAPEARAAAKKAAEVIETARTQKRIWKGVLEKRKEADIKEVKKLSAALEGLRPKKQSMREGTPAAKALQAELLEQLHAGQIDLPQPLWTKALHIVLLNDNDVIAQSKFLLHRYHDEVGLTAGWNWEVMTGEFQAAGLVVRQRDGRHEVATTDGHAVYAVHFGDDRVEPKTGEEGVLRQKGTAGKPTEEARRKEYVRDANGILTRRFQSREINYFHLANMLGLKVDVAADAVVASDLPPGQRPRGAGQNVGGHANVLNVNQPAVVNPETWQGQYEPVGDPEALAESGRSGTRVRPTAPLGPDTPMDRNVASSMQVRNGSGPDQPRLSSTAVQEPLEGYEPKTIRGNKGERFSETNDHVAAVEYDLALAQKAGLEFVNQHSEESHEFKIAYARYKEGSSREEKRSALAELDEYIYSARKNREVTIREVPNTIVTRIKLSGASGLWAKSGLPTDKWLPWDAASRAIKEYVTAQRLKTQHWVASYLDQGDTYAQQAKL